MSFMLPFDLLVSTLNQLPGPVNSYDESSVRTLVSCLAVNSHFRSVASLSHLWEPYYRTRYRHCNADRERQRFELHQGNYYLMYRERRQIDNRALDILNTVVLSRTERQGKACALPDLGYDAWDVLEAEKYQPIPIIFRPNYERDDDSDDDSLTRPHAVTRIFWAKMCQGVIAKRHAISLWSKVHAQRHESAPPSRPSLEEVFAGLSEFFGYSYLELEDRMNHLRLRCKEQLGLQGVVTDPATNGFDINSVCVSVCAFMRSEGLGAVDGSEFHALLNHFPHHYHYNPTIPLPLVSVFVSLLDVFNFRAWPVNVPGRVIARVSNPTIPQKPVFVDVYDSEEHAVLSHENDLPILMARLQADEFGRAADVLAPAYTEDMLLRATRNIFTSFELARRELRTVADVEFVTSAMYAALCADALCTDDIQSCQQLCAHTRMFPLDARAVLLDGLKPQLSHRAAIALQSSYEYYGSPDVDVRKLRSDPRVLFKVGTVFHHKMHKYDGCITGWDSKCEADESWIRRWNVDSLSDGRDQPFYEVTDVLGATRYVAQQNIQPRDLTWKLAREFREKTPSLDRWFEGVKMAEDGLRRFAPTPELQAIYPEDV